MRGPLYETREHKQNENSGGGIPAVHGKPRIYDIIVLLLKPSKKSYKVALFRLFE